jgi:hypothetical protein
MRKSKFTDSQIMDAMKRVEAGFGVPDICRELGIRVILPFCKGARSRNVMQQWPVSASASLAKGEDYPKPCLQNNKEPDLLTSEW